MQQDSAAFDAWWPALRPHLHPALVPPPHHDWLRRMLAEIPRDRAAFLGFEARLGDADGPTDCALSLTAAGARRLAEGHALPQHPAWGRVFAFLRSWGETNATPFADAPCVWLEFDMDGRRDAGAEAGAGAGASAPNLLFGYWPRRPDCRRDRGWLLDRAVPTVLGLELPPPVRAAIGRVLDASPDSGDFQVGLMCARGIPGIRLCVFDLPDAALPDYLRDIGWQGDAQRLAEFVAAFRPHADFVGLHFDVVDRVLPHVGVEPGFASGNWERQPHREPRWHGQFDVLSTAGLLTADKRAALLAWPGYERFATADGRLALLRGLSHLKVVVRPDGRAEAKGYFGIAERPVEEPAGGGDGSHG